MNCKIVTPTSKNGLIKFTAKIIMKTYPSLYESMTLEECMEEEREKFEWYFEGDIDQFRKYAQRKMKAYKILCLK